MSYLAIGICYDHEGFCGSRDTPSDNPQEVADFMWDEFGLAMDELLLVGTEDNGPVILRSWRAGRDYDFKAEGRDE